MSLNSFLKKKCVIEDEIIKFQISDNTTKKVANFYNIKPFIKLNILLPIKPWYGII